MQQQNDSMNEFAVVPGGLRDKKEDCIGRKQLGRRTGSKSPTMRWRSEDSRSSGRSWHTCGTMNWTTDRAGDLDDAAEEGELDVSGEIHQMRCDGGAECFEPTVCSMHTQCSVYACLIVEQSRCLIRSVP